METITYNKIKLKIEEGFKREYFYIDNNGNYILDDNNILKINRSEKIKKILSKK
tara:strand:- start:1592 stop:1753 length:162 start_codon:yes stop_codon:yes gene_type:complete